MREFVVGTGGAFFTGISSARPNSQVRQNNTFGVLKLTLHPTSYDWQFVPEAGQDVQRLGLGHCHRAAGGPGAGHAAADRAAEPDRHRAEPHQVNLSWSASTDNVGVTGYEVFRNGTLLTTTVDDDLHGHDGHPGPAYSYQVRARRRRRQPLRLQQHGDRHAAAPRHAGRRPSRRT